MFIQCLFTDHLHCMINLWIYQTRHHVQCVKCNPSNMYGIHSKCIQQIYTTAIFVPSQGCVHSICTLYACMLTLCMHTLYAHSMHACTLYAHSICTLNEHSLCRCMHEYGLHVYRPICNAISILHFVSQSHSITWDLLRLWQGYVLA